MTRETPDLRAYVMALMGTAVDEGSEDAAIYLADVIGEMDSRAAIGGPVAALPPFMEEPTKALVVPYAPSPEPAPAVLDDLREAVLRGPSRTSHPDSMNAAEWRAAYFALADVAIAQLEKAWAAPAVLDGDELFVRLATAVMQLRDFLALHRKATGRSDVNIRKVLALLDTALEDMPAALTATPSEATE